MKPRITLSITLVFAKRMRMAEEMPTQEEGKIVSTTEYTEENKHGGKKDKVNFKTEEQTKLKEVNGYGDAITKHEEKGCKCVGGGVGCKCVEANPVVTETQIDEEASLSQEDVEEEESRRHHRHHRHRHH